MADVDDRSSGYSNIDRPGALAELAARQHGVVASWQLPRLGYDRWRVHRLVQVAHLHRIYRGVYAVGHRRLTRPGRRMAAVLACGPEALLSHATAIAHWEPRPVAN